MGVEGGGGSFLCFLFFFVFGRFFKVIIIFVIFDLIVMKLIWVYWVVIMVFLFLKVYRWYWSRVVVWRLGEIRFFGIVLIILYFYFYE